MNVTQVPIPEYNGKTGNWMRGRQGHAVTTIVFHQMCGWLSGTDTTFKRPEIVRSSHLGVGEGLTHQYVPLASTAFHAGNWTVNLESVGIEHQGGPIRDAKGNLIQEIPFTDAMYEQAGQTVFWVAQQLGRGVGSFQYRRHGDVADTPCCGTLDVGRIHARALEIEAASQASPMDQPVGGVSIPAQTTSATFQVPTTFWVTVTAPKTLNVRSAPTKESAAHDDKLLYHGDRVEIAEAVQGEIVDGNSYWLRTKVSGLYVWAGGTDFKH